MRKSNLIDESKDSNISKLKAEFVKIYRGNSHIQEVIPVDTTDFIPIKREHLDKLHEFMIHNPIYDGDGDGTKKYQLDVLGIPCMVYEGDINQYWINSLKHYQSNQPFYPTWILSAYAVASEAKRLGTSEMVDIGAGDGRLGYCGEIVGLKKTLGIEIDQSLCDIQKIISDKTGVRFGIKNGDADEFEYSNKQLENPAFFIGGLPEMGEMLAKSIIQKIFVDNNLKNRSTFVFMGSFQLKKFSRSKESWGWGFVLKDAGLCVKSVVVLPTCWTMDQQKDTPYIFTKRCNDNN